MKKFATVLLFVASLAWAQPAPVMPGAPVVPQPVVMPAPVPVRLVAPAPAAVEADAGTPVVDPGSVSVSQALDNPEIFVKYVYTGVKTGNWVLTISALLVMLVGGLRVFGKKIHDMIPKGNVLWGFLDFMLNTKPGGWLMNILTSLAAGMGSAILTDGNVTWALMKPVVEVSLSAAAIWGGVKDFWEWYKGSKAGAAEIAKLEAKVPAAVKDAAPAVIAEVDKTVGKTP